MFCQKNFLGCLESAINLFVTSSKQIKKIYFDKKYEFKNIINGISNFAFYYTLFFMAAWQCVMKLTRALISSRAYYIYIICVLFYYLIYLCGNKYINNVEM